MIQNETKKAWVSVIIPTRNRITFLREAIDSVYSQTYAKFEIIVVDDGSTKDIAPSLASYDGRLSMIRQEHQGVSAARNAGLSKATGEYVAFLDDDDRFLPDKLAKQVAFLSSYPQMGWLCTGFSFIDGDGRPIDREPIIFPSTAITLHDIAMFRFVHTSSVMVRRCMLVHVGGFNTDMCVSEDYEFWARVIGSTQAAALPDILSEYRLHKQSTQLPTGMLLCNNMSIIDAILTDNEKDGLAAREVYAENLHRIIRQTLLHKRKYIAYLCRTIQLFVLKARYGLTPHS